jgi:hypothetical protein
MKIPIKRVHLFEYQSWDLIPDDHLNSTGTL